MKDWKKEYFSETWVEVEADLDFTKYDPVSTSNSLHIYEEKFNILGDVYRVLHSISGDAIPVVEKLVNNKNMSNTSGLNRIDEVKIIINHLKNEVKEIAIGRDTMLTNIIIENGKLLEKYEEELTQLQADYE